MHFHDPCQWFLVIIDLCISQRQDRGCYSRSRWNVSKIAFRVRSQLITFSFTQVHNLSHWVRQNSLPIFGKSLSLTPHTKSAYETAKQKEGPIAIFKDTVKKHGFRGLYSGCSALMIGNAAKAGVRFMSYDHFKHKLADAEVWRYFMSIKRLLRYCTGKNKCSKKSSWYPLFLILIYVGAEYSMTSGFGRRHDGGRFCCYSIGNYQVWLQETYPASPLIVLAFLGRSSSTMPKIQILNTVDWYMEQCLSSNRRASLVYTVAYFPL